MKQKNRVQESKILSQYEKVCENLAKEFASKYFTKDPEIWFVGDDVTGTVYLNDHFFSINEMYEYLKYKYSSKKMFDRYYDLLSHYEKNNSSEGFPNIKAYKHVKKI